MHLPCVPVTKTGLVITWERRLSNLNIFSAALFSSLSSISFSSLPPDIDPPSSLHPPFSCTTQLKCSFLGTPSYTWLLVRFNYHVHAFCPTSALGRRKFRCSCCSILSSGLDVSWAVCFLVVQEVGIRFFFMGWWRCMCLYCFSFLLSLMRIGWYIYSEIGRLLFFCFSLWSGIFFLS